MTSSADQTTSTDHDKRTRHIDLYTIGYGMKTFQEIKDVLVNYGVDQVIDIRYNDYSENRDFNGQNPNTPDLSERFWKHGITYIYRRDLGNPPAIRRLYKSDKRLWREQFFSRFNLNDHVKLQRKVTNSQTVLLCFEKNYRNCHRKDLAYWIAKGSNPRIKVIHL